MRFRVLILAAASLTGAGCDGGPIAPELQSDPAFGVAAGERIVEEYVYDLTGSAFSFACNAQGDPIPPEEGELVYLEGKVVERITSRVDAMGRNHFKVQVFPLGLRGVGEISGEAFRVVERERSVAHQSETMLWGHYRQVQKLVGRETGRTFRLVSSGRYHVANDGTYSRERSREHVECKLYGIAALP